ncbi:hypothetical protein BJ944DRAFT_250372 [Cunninghamella echinulata]|nr:hypothetical protein BJ944DRAFT_250372 [Cunninghamella echinulata]
MAFSQEDSLDKLDSQYLPDKEISTLLSQHNSLTVEEKADLLTTITSTISKWIETIHLQLFKLEQNVKQNNATSGDTHRVDNAVTKMNPIIDSLTDIVELLDDMDDETIALSTKAGITKIQSEWSGLQHFLSSVKQSFLAIDEEKKLRQLMDHVLIQIDDLSLLIFQYQEQRSNGKILTASSTTASNTNSLLDFKDDITTTSNSSAPDDILIDIDNRVGPLFNDVEKIYNRMVSDTPPTDPTGVLAKRHRMVQERWEGLRVEIDELKVDLKEDRWLAVFKQVADQVEAMMDGLDKTVEQCQQMVQQVCEWQGTTTTSSSSNQLSSSSSSTTVTQQQQQYPVPPKGILRSSKSHHSSTSASSTSSSGSNSTPPIDHAKLRSIEKNFEAKYKYCTPLITKMLNMLGSGIAARVSENNATVARHEHMVQRWQKLKSVMDDLRIRSLPDIERLLLFERPISPAWSKVSGSDRGSIYKSPEPMSYDMMFDYRSPSSSINSLNGRARSPLSHQQYGNGNNSNNNNGYMSPTTQLYGAYEELRRVRSVTPSSGTSNRGSGGNDPIALWRSTHGSSPIHSNRSMARTTSPLSSFHHSNYYHHQDILKPSTSDTSSVGSNPSRQSSTMKHQSHAWHDDPPIKQSNTPVPNRPKSRQQDELPLGGRRSVTPVRRAGTPSMIPRPKTPSYNNNESMIQSQIPRRPRSSLLRSPPSTASMRPSDSILSLVSPPSPPHVSKKTLNRKHSTPLLNQHARGIHDDQRYFTQTPPPSSSRRYYDLTEEDEEGYDDDDDYNDYMMYGKSNNLKQQKQRPTYIPDPKDPLDIEVAKIINANPITITCQRGSQSGRYFFGNDPSTAPGGGRKSYTCKLMTYTDRDRRSPNSNRLGSIGKSRNKVLVRVGGGWEDLEVFFLEHHNLMLSH